MEKQRASALIAMNGFKGTLTNLEACDLVSQALSKSNITSHVLPVGDGGRGTIWTVKTVLGGTIVTRSTVDPMGKAVEAKLLCVPNETAPEFLYVESSEACGYHLVPPEERDALRASSHGLGKLLAEVLSEWKSSLKKVYVGLGDSVISDAGMGMLSALGFVFTDQGGRTLWGSAEGLRHIHAFKIPAKPIFAGIKFTVLCDVLNPLCGPKGSALTFAPQKGANPQQVKLIAQGMDHFAKIIQQQTGWNIGNQPMGGSAGGLAAAFRVFLNAELVHGARFVLDWINFDKLLADHDFLVTGEGKTDLQTLQGKAPHECLNRASNLGKKSVLISGKLEDGFEGIAERLNLVGCFACGDSPNAQEALSKKTLEVFSDSEFVAKLK